MHYLEQYHKPYHLPSNIDEMITLAESLAAGFEFIRVDLYQQGHNIYFGELTPTPYPAGISTFAGFDINNLDSALGENGRNTDILLQQAHAWTIFSKYHI